MQWAPIATLLPIALACCSRAPSPPPQAAVPCVASNPDELAACVRQDHYARDLRFVAQRREPGSAHWKRVQDLCVSRFKEQGYELELHAYGTGVNVIGRRAGTDPTELIISAHYDHVAGCEGADDNASGVAALLETSRVLASARFERTLVVACWDEEERGMLGSRAYADRAVARGEPVGLALVYETIGYTSSQPQSQKLPPGLEQLFPGPSKALQARGSRGDFLAAVGNTAASEALAALETRAAGRVPVLALHVPVTPGQPSVLGDLMRSDHASFWHHGIPAIMLTDTADFRNPNYHCIRGRDVPETLDDAFGAAVARATVALSADWLRMRAAGQRPEGTGR